MIISCQDGKHMIKKILQRTIKVLINHEDEEDVQKIIMSVHQNLPKKEIGFNKFSSCDVINLRF